MQERIRSFSSAWAAAMLLVACSEEPAGPPHSAAALGTANQATVSRGTSESSFSGLTTVCGGEFISVTGTIRFRWHITSLPSGDWMLTQHDRISVEGTGTVTGVRYLGHAVGNVTQVFAAPKEGAFTYTQVFRGQDLVQGSADNAAFFLHAKWTINAEGQVTVDIFKVEFDCRG